MPVFLNSHAVLLRAPTARFFATLFLHEFVLLAATTVTSAEMDPQVRLLVQDQRRLQKLHQRFTAVDRQGGGGAHGRDSDSRMSNYRGRG